MCAPGIRSFIRLSQRRIVLLPLPDGPMSAVILFGATSRLMPRTAWNVP